MTEIAQHDTADHQDPVVVSAGHERVELVSSGCDSGEDRHQFVELEVCARRLARRTSPGGKLTVESPDTC
jgi:hypothetical protein